MSEEEINFTKRGFFGWLDRIIFLLIILCHGVAIFEFVKEKSETKITPEWALIWYIIFITFFWSIFLVVFFWRQIKQSHKLRKLRGYVGAYKWFNLAYALIHQIERELNELPADTPIGEDKVAMIINQFETFCSHIASAFNAITGSDVSVCIKLLTEKQVSVKTFLRDNANVNRNYDEDGIAHNIDENTSYNHIFTQIGRGQVSGMNGRYFFSNDLRILRGYKNSSFPIYGQEIYSDDLWNIRRRKRWVMPYTSTIVAGIYPDQKQYYKGKYVIGFLCIDSPISNSFNEITDTSILAGIADTIYNALKKFDKLTS